MFELKVLSIFEFTKGKGSRPFKKFADRYLGPFEVLQAIGSKKQAYKLKLPSHYRIHDLFHVSLLEKMVPSSRSYTGPPYQ